MLEVLKLQFHGLHLKIPVDKTILTYCRQSSPVNKKKQEKVESRTAIS